MKFYKICKYDYFNKNYTNEWSSVKEIKNFKMAREYIRIEKEYIKIILNFYHIYKNLKIEIFEIYCKNKSKNDYKYLNILCKRYKNTYFSNLDKKDLIYLSKSSLREKMWCKLIVKENPNVYISFSWDYYLFLGIDNQISIEDIILNTNLFYYKHSNIFE